MKNIVINVLASETPKQYRDEAGVEQRGKIVVDLSTTPGNLERTVDVQVLFGASQIKVFATNTTTNEQYDCTIDFDA